MAERVTRGHGLMEGLLARRRAAVARRLLQDTPRDSLLDVGCGTFPFFLLSVPARHRVGIDRVVRDEPDGPGGIRLIRHDFETDPRLPLDDASFDAVTMLAVFEHLDPSAIQPLLADIRRVLRPGAPLVLTTPAAWTGPLLRALAALRLVSPEEIREHKDGYDHARVREYLRRAGFADEDIASGRFELGANLWMMARK